MNDNRQKISNRRSLVPPSWRSNVDNSLLKVLSSNRGYVEKLGESVDKISQMSPIDFLNGLSSSWEHHNTFFSSIQDYIQSLPESGNIGSIQREEIQKILSDMHIVDQVTLIYSLGIKPLLNRSSTSGVIPFSSFYIDYPLEHYKVMFGELSPEEVINRYHAGSPELFEQRRNSGMLELMNLEDQRTRRRNKKELERIKTKMYHEALYDGYIDKSTLSKALVRIATIDNTDEYEYLFNLKGIEGFYLKDYLVGHGFLHSPEEPDGRVLDYFNPLRLLDRDKESIGFGEEQVPFYQQSTGVTCAPASVMVAESLLFGGEVSLERELDLHELAKSKVLDGCPFSKISYVLAREEFPLKLRLVHTSPELFRIERVVRILGRLGGEAIEEYQKYVELSQNEGVELCITPNPLKEADRVIEEGGCYMAATQLEGGALHSELVFGKENEKYKVFDPLGGSSYSITSYGLKLSSATSIGHWGLALSIPKPSKSTDYRDAMKFFRREKKNLNKKGIFLSNERRCI